MAWLIMNDIVNYTSKFYPTHILGIDNKLIPVYIGVTSVIDSKENFIGIYVRDKEYLNIDHSRVYVLIHDPDMEQEGVGELISTLDQGERLKRVDKADSADRAHIHMWKE